MSLQLEQDLRFQRVSWRIQRVAWVVVVLLLLAAAAGLLGSGPLSTAVTAVPDRFDVTYQRFSRYQTPETLTLNFWPAVTASGEAAVWFDREYLERTRVGPITPRPTRVEAADQRVRYVFQVNQPGRPLGVTFSLQLQRVGLVRARMGVDDAVRDFWQFVYP
jgi:hypothetical protein